MHVYRWDLDKTYLETDFDSLRGLVRSATEPASAKRAVPGAAALLRAISGQPGSRVFILSGSPVQMRRTLEEKLALDGVTFELCSPMARSCTSARPLGPLDSALMGLPSIGAHTVTNHTGPRTPPRPGRPHRQRTPRPLDLPEVIAARVQLQCRDLATALDVSSARK